MARKAQEDLWAFQPIGAPFPDKPMRVQGQTNQYVALWYKHGKPVAGRAWNNGGVVECSFPFNGRELTGKRDLGGDIQILCFPANDAQDGYERLGYWYQWLPYPEYRDTPGVELLRCGQSTPLLVQAGEGDQQWLLGNLDLSTELAEIPHGGKTKKLEGGAQMAGAWVIVRNLTNPGIVKVHDDQWLDLKVGDPFPEELAVGRTLPQEDGSRQHQCVALWYKHGEPVMGRCWKDSATGKLQAFFGWDGKEFGGAAVGSLQMAAYHKDGRMAFDYNWLPFRQAADNYRQNVKDAYQPVHVGDVCPCVIRDAAGHERLGKAFLSQEKAGAAFNGKEEIYTGPAVADFLVLCRNPPGPRH